VTSQFQDDQSYQQSGLRATTIITTQAIIKVILAHHYSKILYINN